MYFVCLKLIENSKKERLGQVELSYQVHFGTSWLNVHGHVVSFMPKLNFHDLCKVCLE